MMIETTSGIPLEGALLENYFRNLVNLFFKILPMRESETPSLVDYMKSLQAELLGCHEMIAAVNADPQLVTLLSILQYLIDYPDTHVLTVKREVFKAISICNKLSARYATPPTREE